MSTRIDVVFQLVDPHGPAQAHHSWPMPPRTGDFVMLAFNPSGRLSTYRVTGVRWVDPEGSACLVTVVPE